MAHPNAYLFALMDGKDQRAKVLASVQGRDNMGMAYGDPRQDDTLLALRDEGLIVLGCFPGYPAGWVMTQAGREEIARLLEAMNPARLAA